ncbi:hypothetical protein Cgig2_033654 [Carnegiea gigantea]|uniref:Uncharacterized protein n=1 Tax=Carnegiea gigantea TaxID=171969 RepID=A0A9Q1GIJ6_9CARY|nr:hypothetical protein Cgig2_033654 [Carnegiea gigantea]
MTSKCCNPFPFIPHSLLFILKVTERLLKLSRSSAEKIQRYPFAKVIALIHNWTVGNRNELHSKKSLTGRSSKPNLEVEARKRQRRFEGPNLVGSNDGERNEMRCVLQGDLWQDSSGSEYEPHSEEERDTNYEISLEAKSDVDENMGEGDGGSTLSNGGAEMRGWYSGGEGHTGGEYRRRDRPSTAFKQGKAKGAIATERNQLHREVVGKGDLDVLVRSRCTIRTLVGVNRRMTPNQRETMKATVLWPFLEYPKIGMERHLMLALIKCWVPRWKAFRIGGRWVPFSIYGAAFVYWFIGDRIGFMSTPQCLQIRISEGSPVLEARLELTMGEAVKTSEVAVGGVPEAVQGDMEVIRGLTGEDGDGGVGFNAGHVDDGEEGQVP